MDTPSFAEFRRRILAIYDGPARSVRTAKKMSRVLALVAGLGVERLGDLTTETAARFVAARSKAVCPNTVRGEASYLRAACNYALEEGWLERGPRWKRVMPRPSKPGRITLHRFEDVRRVLDLLKARSANWRDHRLYALAATVAYTGLRRDEALRMRVEHVHLEAGILCVVARGRLKTEASEAPVPIPPDLVEILADWIPRAGSDWLFPAVRRQVPWRNGRPGTRPLDRLKAAGSQVGIEGLTFQSLRHTFATYARRRFGLSDIQLRDVLRHTTVKTQESYVHDELEIAPLVASVRSVSYR